ncbi:MAG: aldehyde dehydrogenase family protein [Deltaproteobacteria bacterium]|nr:aldehyde dehydrogenase family protein [Deltaproteobacteria bacterium]
MSDSYEDRSFAKLFPTKATIPDAARIDPKANPPRMLIDGKVRTVDEDDPDQQLPVYSRVAVRDGNELSPVLLGHEPKLGVLEVGEAMAAAERVLAAGATWATAPIETRITAVEKLAARLAADVERIATLLMWEIGKPVASARQEVTRSIDYIKDTIAELRALDRDRVVYTGVVGHTQHVAKDVTRPLGTVLCVAPFNYPVNEFLTTIIPALLMGNVVIAKTPRFGMLANMALMDAFADAFPPGVVALLPGDGRAVLPGVISHKSNDVFGNAKGTVDVFAFIGSEGAANAILKGHPTPSFVHKILGLGAKNAGIVLAGADIDAVATRLVKGSLGFNGQRCTAEKIIFAPAGAEGDALVAAIAKRVTALPLGMPWDPVAAITPLPEPQKLEVMWGLIGDAVAKGARIANDGGGRGYYSIMRPAVLDRVALGMKIYDEEQFGPVVPIVRYERVQEVIDWHVRSPYGQQAGIHGPDSPTRGDLAMALTSYVARVNLDDVCQRGPDTFGFTAADKSGHGTLSIRAALLSFSRSVIVQSPLRAAIEHV